VNPNPFASDTLRFGSLWTIGMAALSLSAVRRQQHILPPSGEAAAVHLTLVARLPRQATSGIEEILAELKRGDPSHHYYPTDTIHLTIRNFDQAKDVDRSQLLAQLRHCTNSLRPFSLKARGPGCFPQFRFPAAISRRSLAVGTETQACIVDPGQFSRAKANNGFARGARSPVSQARICEPDPLFGPDISPFHPRTRAPSHDQLRQLLRGSNRTCANGQAVLCRRHDNDRSDAVGAVDSTRAVVGRMIGALSDRPLIA
jgi:hypothetical protein